MSCSNNGKFKKMFALKSYSLALNTLNLKLKMHTKNVLENKKRKISKIIDINQNM
jgi:hypothetical protein